MDPVKKWNPRYEFYAQAHGRTPQEQMDHDAPKGGSGIYKFVLWVRKMTAQYALTCPVVHVRGLQGAPGSAWSYRNTTREGLAAFMAKKFPKVSIAW